MFGAFAWRRVRELLRAPDSVEVPASDAVGPYSIEPLIPRRYAEAFQLPGRRGPHKTLGGFKKYLDRRSVRAFGAFVDARLVGYVAFEVREDCLNVTLLYVARDQRRRGVGRSLVRAVLARSAACGGREARFAVPDAKVNAHHMLKRCGLVARCVRNYFRDGGDAYVFTPPAAVLVARP